LTNCPRATNYSHDRERTTALLGGLVALGSLFTIYAFIDSTFSLFTEHNWSNFFTAFAFINLIALWDLYMFILRDNNTECNINIILIEEELLEEDDCEKSEYIKQQIPLLKKENKRKNIKITKKYFLWFYLGLFVTIAIVGIISTFN